MDDEEQIVVGLRFIGDVLEKLADLRPGDILILEANHVGVTVAFQPGLYRDEYVPLLALLPESVLERWANG